jgi:hypothetical protein
MPPLLASEAVVNWVSHKALPQNTRALATPVTSAPNSLPLCNLSPGVLAAVPQVKLAPGDDSDMDGRARLLPLLSETNWVFPSKEHPFRFCGPWESR